MNSYILCKSRHPLLVQNKRRPDLKKEISFNYVFSRLLQPHFVPSKLKNINIIYIYIILLLKELQNMKTVHLQHNIQRLDIKKKKKS